MAHLRKTGEAAFSKVEKINSELFSLTYVAIVTQLLKDYEEVDATNEQLEKMCYIFGVAHQSCCDGAILSNRPGFCS